MIAKISRKANFNAAHRLNNPNWSAEKNKEIFGKCNNEYFHGHNYELIVSVKGEIDPETGFVMDAKVLDNLIKTHIQESFDHKNLNIEVEEFKTLNPTAENIALVILQKLRPFIPKAFSLEITLYETPKNFVTIQD